MTTPGRSGQAGGAPGRSGTVRIPAVPVTGGMPTPGPPFAPCPCFPRVYARGFGEVLRACNLTDEREARFVRGRSRLTAEGSRVTVTRRTGTLADALRSAG